MPDYYILDELRTYLIAQGVVQAQSATPSLTVPSIWLMPRDGAPQPRRVDGAFVENTTVTLVDTALSPPAPLVAWIEEAFIDVIVRSRSASTAKLVQRQIRGLLHPYDAHGGRKQWPMGALTVERSTIWRGDQPHPGTDDVSWARTQGFRIEVRRKLLAGLSIP